jgi:hypothetical protein
VNNASRWIEPGRRLDAGSKATLASAINQLPAEDRGWITLEEAGRLFSNMPSQYAFGEMDDDGKRNLEAFARDVSREFEFWPNENRLYFNARAV